MPRIALISEHASPLATLGGTDSGGQNVYVAEVARHLAKMGYEIDVFTRRDSPLLPQVVLYSAGVRVVHIDAGPAIQMPKETLLPYMDEFAEQMVAFIGNSPAPYDLVHANFFMSGYVAIILKKALGLPFVVTFHALGKVRRVHQGNSDQFPATRSAIEKHVMQEAAAIIAECPQDRTDLLTLYGADEDKIVIIPCGVNPAEFYPVPKHIARARIGVAADSRIVLQLGRMVPRKGIETTIRGFSELVHTHQVKAQLLIVGGDSADPDPGITPEVGRLQQIASECRVTQDVKFIGARPRQELKYYYSAANAFVSTPWYEPFGITPLEAMACGTPVIGSKVGGIKYTVQDGKTGFLVPPESPAELGNKLAKLFNDRSRLRRLTRNCVQHVNKFFTWTKVCTNLSALYNNIRPRHFRSLTSLKPNQIERRRRPSVAL